MLFATLDYPQGRDPIPLNENFCKAGLFNIAIIVTRVPRVDCKKDKRGFSRVHHAMSPIGGIYAKTPGRISTVSKLPSTVCIKRQPFPSKPK